MSGSIRGRAATVGRGDYRYLIQPRGNGTTWYVSVSVPRPLRKALGKKTLVRSLNTTDIQQARIRRFAALAELKAEIEKVRQGGEGDAVKQEALEWRGYLSSMPDEVARDIALDRIIERTEEISYRDQKPKEAAAFFELATGKATPLTTYLDRWLAGTTYTARTKADARTALRQLEDWCVQSGHPAFVEKISDRVAADFRDEALLKRGVHRRTANKKLSMLRRYWTWLDRSLGMRPNPWAGKSLPKTQVNLIQADGPEGRERPFTDDELRNLLSGDADPDLADLMRIAALSGMRLEEIGQLRVADCRDGLFNIRQGKTAAAVRTVPIHSALRHIVLRRVAGRGADEFLFPNLRGTGWDGNRTMAVSKRFKTYRCRLGVDDRRGTSRRSKVNFHSFRRWFATKAEEAGIAENVIAAVMGHKKEGITLGVYSQAQLVEPKRRCVEAISLPNIERQRKRRG